MRLILSLLTALLIAATVSGCAPMNFVNGPIIGDTVKREHWHHLTAAGLIELSEPFNMDYYCDDKEWEKVTVVLKAPNIMASASVFYNPWSINYECREPIE